jgi:ubiquinone/menaquinone biosynthesis C-methylase UbiE
MTQWAKKRTVMLRYNSTANIYDLRYAEEQMAKIRAAIGHVKIKEDDIVLDAGCGTGLFFECIADKARTIVGVDLSKKTLLQAKKRVGEFLNVHLVLGDVDYLPLLPSCFSKVFAFTLLQNTPDSLRTLKEIRLVSSHDSTIVVTGLKKIFTLEVFQRILFKSGFEVIALESEGVKCYVAVCKIVH